MRTTEEYHPYLSPISWILSLVAFAFITTASTGVRAEYYYEEGCDVGEAYWVTTPVYHSCKPHKKEYYQPIKKKKVHVKKHYYQPVIVPVYAPACRECRSSCQCDSCQCDDCCGDYNPDLTTGDDDPSVYPDLNIDR